MICISINGGLGNQMFQYACGKALALKHETSLVVYLDSINKNSKTTTNRFVQLEVFKLKLNVANLSELKILRPLFYRILNTLSFKFGFKGIQKPSYFVEKNFSYNSKINKVSKNCFLSGYWQSSKYFNSFESIIRKEFTFKDRLVGKNLSIFHEIRNSNSISLHIRRTDFLTTANNKTHGVCSLEYYKTAIQFICEKINNPIFFVFSDDIQWAIKNMTMPYEFTFVSENYNENSHIDMHLMSICKHNIIANSSFSWWGAWLNQNPNKIVISPKNWFLNKKLNDQTGDLIPDSWIRM
jgi:hypothetical protein